MNFVLIINLLKVRLMKNKFFKNDLQLKKVFVQKGFIKISAAIWHVTDFDTKAGSL